MDTGRVGDRATSRRARTVLASGVAVVAVIVVLAYFLTPTPLAPAAAPTADGGAALAPRPAALAPERLADLTPSERYFNSDTENPGTALPGAGGRIVLAIRPELDERRQGYLVYQVGARYTVLSAAAGLGERASAGQRLDILGDGRLLFSEVIGTGAARTVPDLDITGIDELRFVATATGPATTGNPADETLPIDPVVR